MTPLNRFTNLYRFICIRWSVYSWVDYKGARYEWHPGDPMRLRDVALWHMTQSPNRFVRRWAQRKWGV